MAKKGSGILLDEARETLEDLGYRTIHEDPSFFYSDQVFSLVKDKKEEKFCFSVVQFNWTIAL